MKVLPLLLALSLATVGLAALPGASAARCVYGDDPEACLVSVQFIVCVTDPCDGVIVCVARATVCSNDLP